MSPSRLRFRSGELEIKVNLECSRALTTRYASDKRLLKDKHYGSVDMNVFDHVNPLLPEADVPLEFDGGAGQVDVHLAWSFPSGAGASTDTPDSPSSIKTSRSRFSTSRRSIHQNGD
jgi:hypothetical protein